ncbi:hypothetical protein V6Z11_A01G147600 [Gossypium hirsutum]
MLDTTRSCLWLLLLVLGLLLFITNEAYMIDMNYYWRETEIMNRLSIFIIENDVALLIWWLLQQ